MDFSRKALTDCEENILLKNGRYRVLSLIAEGGSALIYWAENTENNNKCVIKEICPDVATIKTHKGIKRLDDGSLSLVEHLENYDGKKEDYAINDNSLYDDFGNETLKRLKLDIQRAKQEFEDFRVLSEETDYVLQKMDKFYENNTFYVVGHFVGHYKRCRFSDKEKGVTLGKYVSLYRDEIDLKKALEITVRILEALTPIHRNAYLHLDISPANILLTDISPTPFPIIYLIDFNSMHKLNKNNTITIEPGQEVYISKNDAFSAPEVINYAALCEEGLYEEAQNDILKNISYHSDICSVIKILAYLLDCEQVQKSTVLLTDGNKISDDVIHKVNNILKKGISGAYNTCKEAADDIIDLLKFLGSDVSVLQNRLNGLHNKMEEIYGVMQDGFKVSIEHQKDMKKTIKYISIAGGIFLAIILIFSLCTFKISKNTFEYIVAPNPENGLLKDEKMHDNPVAEGEIISDSLNWEDLGLPASDYGEEVKDSFGNIIERRYYNVAHTLIENNEGFAIVNYMYDGNNRVIRKEYLDIYSELVQHSSMGVAIETFSYDDANKYMIYQCFGTDKTPVLRKDYGYTSYKVTYDNNGNAIECNYFGLDGEPVLVRGEHYSSYKSSYDKNGNEIARLFFGIDGNAAASRPSWNLGLPRPGI